jgi:hypothetical protein
MLEGTETPHYMARFQSSEEEQYVAGILSGLLGRWVAWWQENHRALGRYCEAEYNEEK